MTDIIEKAAEAAGRAERPLAMGDLVRQTHALHGRCAKAVRRGRGLIVGTTATEAWISWMGKTNSTSILPISELERIP